MSALGKFLRTPLRRKVLVVRATAALLLAKTMLRAVSLKRLRALQPVIARQQGTLAVDGVVAADAWAVLATARSLPWSSSCLERSLALWWLLHRDGISSTVRIGVRPEEGALSAHAWVERNGEVLFDEEVSRFIAFDTALVASE